MKDVLERIREINRLLQSGEWSLGLQPSSKETTDALPLDQLAHSLGNILHADTYLIDENGMLRGFHEQNMINTPRIKDMLTMQQFPEEYTQSVAEITSTQANLDVDSPQSIVPIEIKQDYPDALTTIIPIYVSKERLGTLILGRINDSFYDKDLIVAEHAATAVGIELLYNSHIKIATEMRKQKASEMTIRSLSYSEQKAVAAVFEALAEKEEGILTATNIADEIGITRSVVVNALRKLESGGIIESKSLGMKGTYIKVLNDTFVSLIHSVQK